MLQNKLWSRLLILPALLITITACDTLQSPTYYDDDDDDTNQDSILTHRVKSALDADPDIKGFHIKVDTVDGVVELIGFVDSTANEIKAMKIAQSAKEVTQVKDELVVANRGDLYR